MVPSSQLSVRPSLPGEPVWELAELFPEQGGWNEADYLRLTTNRLVEFEDGNLQVLPMPDAVHQMIVLLLCTALNQLRMNGLGGRALPAPFRLKVRGGKWREPDVLYLAPAQMNHYRKDWWDFASLVVEVVSEDDPNRDYVSKRADYAGAGVAEYWIVDPMLLKITVLSLDGTTYREAQIAGDGEVARSVAFPEFHVDVSDLFRSAGV